MHMRVVLVTALICSTTLLTAAPQSARATSQKPPTLAERFPPPPGYGVEQDVESDSMRSFSTATDVRGHIIRRYVQAGDDGPTSVPDIARYFADLLHAQGGSLFDDRINNRAGRLDGRIPGPRPVWLHVEINDDGGALDITALEESAASTREMPLEDTRIAGSWATTEAFTEMATADRASAVRVRDALSALVAPTFKPLLGWAWQVTAEELRDGSAATTTTLPYRVRVSGVQRSQACATCPVTADTQSVTAFTMDVNRIESLGALDPTTAPAQGVFLDPGFMPSAQVTHFLDGAKILVTRANRPALFLSIDREGPDGRRLAQLNPAYFEARRDRSAPQFVVIDIPWKHGVGEVSLYQRDLVDAFLASAKLADLLK